PIWRRTAARPGSRRPGSAAPEISGPPETPRVFLQLPLLPLPGTARADLRLPQSRRRTRRRACLDYAWAPPLSRAALMGIALYVTAAGRKRTANGILGANSSPLLLSDDRRAIRLRRLRLRVLSISVRRIH